MAQKMKLEEGNMRWDLRKGLMALCFCAALQAPAQENPGYKHCGTDEATKNMFFQHPELKAAYEAREAVLEAEDKQAFALGYPRNQEKSSGPTFIIPIVFHILHNYGPENISDAQIMDEMRILNLDYRKLNADTTAVDTPFVSLIADTKVEFRLAQLDPNGNCTNGIDRIPSLQTYVGDDGSKLNDWPHNKYLNVWVVSSISNGAAGYAYLPGTCPSAADGIMILSSYIGSIGTSSPVTSRALTHEIGHFLNLKHCWGSTNVPGVSCGDDGVSDTPITEGWNHCPASPSAAMICNAGVEENYQNYMEYSYCTHMFTMGQSNRMTNALNSTTASRNNLWSAANLTATGVNNVPVVCAPMADFTSNATVLLCAGQSASFNYIEMNGQPTSWSWNFPGGTPSTSTDSTPTITYSTPGTYNVSMTVTNSAGTNTKTRNGLVIVSALTAMYNQNFWIEGFENATTFANDWIIVNPQGNAWMRTTTAASFGSASMMIQNQTSTIGEVDLAVSPSIDIASIPNPTFAFQVAYAQQTSTDADRLRVMFSSDCGATYGVRYSKQGNTLATASPTTASFVPTNAQWRTETAYLGSNTSTTNFRAMFEMTKNNGNNLYVDNINIVSTVAGILEEVAGVNNFFIYPNPTSDNTFLSFTSTETLPVKIRVYDVVGREMMTIADEILPAGDHKFTMAAGQTLPPGMYFVNLNVNNRQLSQKLIVR
jgi:PKD repeat protein